MSSPKTRVVEVFTAGAAGGNPAPVTVDADTLSEEDMRALAARYGQEAGFVLRPSNPKAQLRYRFFVPRHEMEMCGHATLGTTWLLARDGRIAPGEVVVETKSGLVRTRISESGQVAVAQPRGRVDEVAADARSEILSVLGLRERDLLDLPLLNAATSRVKTIVPLASPAILNGLAPDYSRMEALCARIGSTGLYPFACDWDDERTYHARQFPRSAGYPEDAATGIAATALLFALRHYGLIKNRKTIRVRQGEAMGRPSRIAVTLDPGRDPDVGCWLTGEVRLAAA